MATLSGKPRTTSFLGAACLAAAFLAVFFIATLLGQDPARQTIGWAAAYTVFGIAPPLVLSLLEHLTRPAGPRKSAQKWLLHFQIMLANYAAAVPLGLLAAYLATLLVKSLGLNLGLVDLRIGTGKEIASIAAGFLLSALLGDFFFYWYHRCLHKSNLLWQHHKMHHLDPEFDALTGPRQNWLESFFLVFCNIIPMAVFFKFNDLDPLDAGLIQGTVVGFAATVTVSKPQQFALAIRQGQPCLHELTDASDSPQLSTATSRQEFRCVFPDWDVLFGTYYHPGLRRVSAHGSGGRNRHSVRLGSADLSLAGMVEDVARTSDGRTCSSKPASDMANLTRRDAALLGLAAMTSVRAADAATTAAEPLRESGAEEPLSYVDPELRAFLRTLPPDTPITAADVGQWRQSAEPSAPVPDGVLVRSIPGSRGAPNVRIFIFGKSLGGVLVPGFSTCMAADTSVGSTATSWPGFAGLQKIAADHDCMVVSVDYRLAPETPFPGSLEDNYAALKWLHVNAESLGVDPAE